jgi:hypothetical protein
MLGMTSRDVPDSARLSYEEVWVEGEAAYWEFGPTNWSLGVSHRDRSYEADAAARDHARSAFELESRWQATGRLRVEGLLAWEYWNYRQDSSAYYDFGTGETELLCRYELTPHWDCGIDVRGRWERAIRAPYTEDDFAEIALGPLVAWKPDDLIWIELGSRWGRRHYDPASTVYDDYRFVEADLRADGAVGQHLTLSAALSYQEEQHDDPARDADYTYGSLALRFPFRL